MWKPVGRPGYFGRRRDEIVAKLDQEHGVGKWRLVWVVDGLYHTFAAACRLYYEESYLQYLRNRPEDVDYICTFQECMDNAVTNINSGRDYTKQEAYSTHIQDIAIRNVLAILGRKFEGGPLGGILVIRSADTAGFRFGPGNVPFFRPSLITQPSLRPRWAKPDSVEDFWQSNKWLERWQQEP